MVSIQPQQSLTPHFAIEPLPYPSNCNLLIAAASCYIPQQVLGQMLAFDWLQHETAIAIQFEFNRLWNDQPLASEPLLCRGDRSPAVLALKTLLNHQNGLLVPQEGTIDDEFSALTHVTVIRFQLQHSLLDDGIVGPVTWRQLRCPAKLPRLALQLTHYQFPNKPFHQAALRWLQTQLSDVVLSEFKLRWETAEDREVAFSSTPRDVL